MLTAQPEPWLPNVPELARLLPEHYDKLALNRDKVPLSMQWGEYERLNQLGQLVFIPLRDGGRMVGYWIGVVAPGLHYSTCLTATMDAWNVIDEYQGTKAALVLMRAVEREYRRRGVQRSFVGEKIHRPCGKLYRAFGYEAIETYYSKWLGD